MNFGRRQRRATLDRLAVMIERQQELIDAQTAALQRQNFLIDQLPRWDGAIAALTHRIAALENGGAA